MPAEFEIDPEQGVVLSRGFGVFTHADYLDQMERLRRDSRFRPEFNQLVDCRAITLMNLTAAEIQDLAKKSVFNPESRRAFVVTSEIQYGLSRMLGSYRDVHGKQTLLVFKEMAEALSWLNLPLSYTPKHAEKSTPPPPLVPTDSAE